MTLEEIAERIEAISDELNRVLEGDGDRQYAAEAALASLDSLAVDVRESA
jgi:archaellum component FlaC